MATTKRKTIANRLTPVMTDRVAAAVLSDDPFPSLKPWRLILDLMTKRWWASERVSLLGYEWECVERLFPSFSFSSLSLFLPRIFLSLLIGRRGKNTTFLLLLAVIRDASLSLCLTNHVKRYFTLICLSIKQTEDGKDAELIWMMMMKTTSKCVDMQWLTGELLLIDQSEEKDSSNSNSNSFSSISPVIESILMNLGRKTDYHWKWAERNDVQIKRRQRLEKIRRSSSSSLSPTFFVFIDHSESNDRAHRHTRPRLPAWTSCEFND